MKKFLYFAAALVLLALSGCATSRFTFNGESYGSAPEALNAQKELLDKMLAEVKTRDNSINGTILVVTPTPSAIEALGIKRTGTPKQEAVDYLTKFTVADHQFFVDALRKSNLFTQTESRVAEHTLKEARLAEEKFSAVIYFHLVSPTQMGWYLIKSGVNSPVQINMDAVAKGAARIESWIDSVASAYKKRD